MGTLHIKVKPNARYSQIEKGDDAWIIALPVPPVDGKANAALLKLLAKELGLPKSAIQIKSGHTSRYKIIEFEGDLPCE
jgi:uncharacterized protein YggU (UPF0235/DUF167 family)